VPGEVFVRLPDGPQTEETTIRAFQESLRVASSFLRFGRARARSHASVELAAGAIGLLFRVAPGHEDPLIERVHAWFIDELDARHLEVESTDMEPPRERHRRAWKDPDELRRREIDGRLDVFVACRIPVVRPAPDISSGDRRAKQVFDTPGDDRPVEPPEPASLSRVFDLWSSGHIGAGVTVLLMDTGVDVGVLERMGHRPSQIHWLSSPRRTAGGRYERSHRAGDRQVGLHGTGMAAAILEQAPGASILVLPVLDPNEATGTSAHILTLGMIQALGQDPSHQINMSLVIDDEHDSRGQMYKTASTLEFSLDSALERGTIIVAAVGNSDPADIGFGWPARNPGVVAAGAVELEDGQFRRSPDSRYDPAGPPSSDHLWVEEGGRLVGGQVVRSGVVVDGIGLAGSSVACARASGRLAAWRSRKAQDLGRLPNAEETRRGLEGAPLNGLDSLGVAERGRGWARPV
jgi:subtilisin family serine protease